MSDSIMQPTQLTYPTIAVIILNWNGLNDTLACVDSVNESTYRGIKIYVIDNGSRNGEALAIKEKYPSVAVISLDNNLGFCGGNNVAIRRIIEDGHKFTLLVNNDTLVPNDMITRLLEAMLTLGDAGSVGPLICDYPQVERVSFSKAQWNTSKAIFNHFIIEDVNVAEGLSKPYETDFVCGCCLLTRTELWEKVGLLDERYFAYYEEADWCFRLRRIGYKSFIVPDTKIYHRTSRSNSVKPLSVYLLSRNRLLWMHENLKFFVRLKSFPWLIREFVWHLINMVGLRKSNYGYSSNDSKAYLFGVKDYFFGRFGKWREKRENILFKK